MIRNLFLHAKRCVLTGLVISGLVLLLSGCELLELFGESEQEQVKSSAEEWVDAQGMNPVNEDGSVNPDGAAKVAKRAITGSTGDPEVDAALNSDNAILKMRQADDLEQRGWKENDGKYFDQAIKLRPEDWKYYISRAAWNMDYYANPDMDKNDRDFAKAESLLGPDKNERLRYAEQGIQQLEKVKVTMSKPYRKGEQADLFKSSHQCRTMFARLVHFYNMRSDLTGNADDRIIAEQYTNDLSNCPPAP